MVIEKEEARKMWGLVLASQKKWSSSNDVARNRAITIESSKNFNHGYDVPKTLDNPKTLH